jgi:hypothetical protein
MVPSSVAAFYAFARCCFYWSRPNIIGPQRILQFETVIHRAPQVLFATQVSLGCLHGHMTEQELNLLQLATAVVAELGAGSPQVVGRDVF